MKIAITGHRPERLNGHEQEIRNWIDEFLTGVKINDSGIIYLHEDINNKYCQYYTENYSKQSYYIRDKYMVDHCDVLLAVWDGKKVGGTWLTVKYAQSIGKEIIFFPQSILTSC